MGDPPSLDGAVKLMLACPLPGTAVPIVGGVGTVAATDVNVAMTVQLAVTGLVVKL